MRAAPFPIALLIAVSPAAAHGQSLSDDVRCLLVSNVFAKGAKEDKARQIATANTAFYLGRVSGRPNTAEVGAAMRAQSAAITAKNVAPIMNACAARMVQAERSLQSLAQSVAPKK